MSIPSSQRAIRSTDSTESFVGTASVQKAVRVLRTFKPSVGVLSVRQIAERASLPRSTTHELCRTLVGDGLLEHTAAGYQLGPLLMELAGQVILRTGLLRASEGTLDRLVRAPEQEAHLGQLSPTGWVGLLDRKCSTRQIPMYDRVGQYRPAHLTGCGKAALSRLPFVDALALVEKCCGEGGLAMPERDELENDLTSARRNGYAVLQPRRGRIAIGAAILDATGAPLGGISLTGPVAMVNSAAFDAARTAVTDAAKSITARVISVSPRSSSA